MELSEAIEQMEHEQEQLSSKSHCIHNTEALDLVLDAAKRSNDLVNAFKSWAEARTKEDAEFDKEWDK